MNRDTLFPTFRRWLAYAWPLRLIPNQSPVFAWKGATWWPGETLASKQYALLRMLAVAHRERLELVPLLRSLTNEFRFSYRRKLRQLDGLLTQQISLVAAIEQIPDLLSEQTVLALRFASQSGTLASTYEQLLQTECPAIDRSDIEMKGAKVYWFFLMLAMLLIILFLMTFIFPTVRKMISEFGATLPSSLYWLVACCQWLWGHPWIVIGVLVTIAWFVFSSVARRMWRRTKLYGILWNASQSHSADLYRLLAISIDAGRPMAGTLSTLARYHFDKRVRQQLLLARNEIEQGVEDWQSLSDARLVDSSVANALAKTPCNPLRAWTLRQLASDKAELFRRRSRIVLAILKPLVTMLFAAVVLWICVSLFQSLARFIQINV